MRALACVKVTHILGDLYRLVVRHLPLRLHQCLNLTPAVVLPTSPASEVAGRGDGLLLLFDRLLDCPALGLLAGTQVSAFLSRLEFLSRAWREEYHADSAMQSAAGGGSVTVIDWLLDSDPSVRWQAMRDLADASADEIAVERARVAREGAGGRLLALQGADGTWGGAAWNRGWDSTMHVLSLLREMGLDPASDPAHRAVGLVRGRVTWQGCGPPECDDNPFFAGEVEPCINGQVAASGAYFGQDVHGIVDRLLGEQLPDGGWNCEAERGSTRSSFNTTICVLDALLEQEHAGAGTPEVTDAHLRGQEYLLECRLFRRKSTGAVVDITWTRFSFPTWWHYDVLRGLDYLRRAGVAPDGRVTEAINLVASKRDADGRWPFETRHPGKMLVETDEGEGRPSRWNTLRALRVLRWYDRA